MWETEMFNYQSQTNKKRLGIPAITGLIHLKNKNGE